ncbi:DDE-type integrase/transposase/recombinase [Aneurinibacillus aneurinilyticus]|uniref:DDE-type integrase/transposase/recombinase n=1 Tax=Aneurinibacillus aneurinilyticus TaxID=1391 RepID=UPI00399CD708
MGMANIMYIHIQESQLYLASIIDLYSRKIVGWHTDKQMMKKRILKYMACFSQFHVFNISPEFLYPTAFK